MKKRILSAVLGAMLMQVMPASAAYESPEEISLALRSMTGGKGVYLSEDKPNRIYVTPDAAAAGTTAHFGVYIEAERAELAFISLQIQSDCDTVTFNEETYQSPKSDFSETPKTYFMPDGTPFQSRWNPYCLGILRDDGSYNPDCYSMLTNFVTEENLLRLTWMHGLGNAESFFGGRSDCYSFIEFDVNIAAGTEPGVHRLSFLENTDPTVSASQSPTCITSDESNGGPSKYADIVPGLKNAEIVVGTRGDVNLDGSVNAADAAAVLIFAAEKGSGGTPLLTGGTDAYEQFAQELADVNRKDGAELKLDASDAACILIYAAAVGSGNEADWDTILH